MGKNKKGRIQLNLIPHSFLSLSGQETHNLHKKKKKIHVSLGVHDGKCWIYSHLVNDNAKDSCIMTPYFEVSKMLPIFARGGAGSHA